MAETGLFKFKEPVRDPIRKLMQYKAQAATPVHMSSIY